MCQPGKYRTMTCSTPKINIASLEAYKDKSEGIDPENNKVRGGGGRAVTNCHPYIFRCRVPTGQFRPI